MSISNLLLLIRTNCLKHTRPHKAHSIACMLYICLTLNFSFFLLVKISTELFDSKTSLKVTSQLPLIQFYLKHCAITIMSTFILLVFSYLFVLFVSQVNNKLKTESHFQSIFQTYSQSLFQTDSQSTLTFLFTALARN